MSWPIVNLGDVCQKVDYGLTASAAERIDGPRFLRITDMQDDTVDWDTVPSCECSEREYDQNKLAVGDIVFARTGATTGKSFLIRHLSKPAVFASYLIRVRPSQSLDPIYLSYFLKSSMYWHQISTMASGAAQPGVNSSKLKELSLPLPPLPEQKRIAAILDKADTIRRKRQQAIQLADDFLRSVFIDMFGDPVANPKGWPAKSISAGLESITSGWSAVGDSRPCENGERGVLKISAVTSGIFKPEKNKKVSPDTIPEGKKLLFPKKGDLLFSRANTRELVAATCLVKVDVENVFLPDKLWLVRTKPEELFPEFLNYLIWQPSFKERLTSQATGTSGSMLNISKQKFEDTAAIFPCLELQKKFARIYWGCQAIVESLLESSEKAERLFGSLSQKAFSGHL
ncbi:hypothetical protein ALO52_200008 [Pseudomonas syringae pv. primulae]|uniref:Type I restriction modification DNA specificity domain-containing protein n=1 Tax=Pseudomonas syringae pv. primulae TaxID=251707 RepID=A0A0N8SJ57_9PSED|nr:restriction endonuclease subunit S [Pseudomonas syringae group genomosp. 3]KPY31464.1 hypothetical protein ALO52_200008 [Pseudomonas syringae pv. primulae]